MPHDPNSAAPKSRLATALFVPLAFFAAGLVGAAFPYGWTAALVSAILFVGLLVFYGLRSKRGRGSGGPAFVLGGLLIFPALIAWYVPILAIEPIRPPLSAVLDYMSKMQVGGSLRRCGVWEICGPVWWVFTLMMIGLAVLIRDAILLLGKD